VRRGGIRRAAGAAVRYSTIRQRPDGSWPYGERPNLAWVDNFHTGYVLDALRICADAGVGGPEVEEAWTRGIAFYRRELFLPMAPRSTTRPRSSRSMPSVSPRESRPSRSPLDATSPALRRRGPCTATPGAA
jgi:hypothetical protein